VFATRFARLLEHGGLPAPEIEHTIFDTHGRFIARADLCYPRERLVIELDDWGTHSSPKALERDTKRQNAILECGFTIRRFTWNDLDRPAYVTGVVRRALVQLGHPAVSL
jgi:very-short-patch-repair endonuclease